MQKIKFCTSIDRSNIFCARSRGAASDTNQAPDFRKPLRCTYTRAARSTLLFFKVGSFFSACLATMTKRERVTDKQIARAPVRPINSRRQPGLDEREREGRDKQIARAPVRPVHGRSQPGLDGLHRRGLGRRGLADEHVHALHRLFEEEENILVSPPRFSAAAASI